MVTQEIRLTTLLALALLALPLAALIYFKNRAYDREVLAESRKERVELRAQMESQMQLLTDLGAKLEKVRDDLGWLKPAANSPSLTSSFAPAELQRRIVDLTEQQSRLLDWFQRQAPQMIEPVSPEQQRLLRESAIAMLKERLSEQLKSVEDLQAKLDSLRADLRVPDEIAVMDSDKAVDDPRLSAYRSYFEAKRKRDQDRGIARILETKLAAEEFDLTIPRSP